MRLPRAVGTTPSSPTALLTGLRCSELAHLKLAHINLDAGTLRVVQGKRESVTAAL